MTRMMTARLASDLQVHVTVVDDVQSKVLWQILPRMTIEACEDDSCDILEMLT